VVLRDHATCKSEKDHPLITPITQIAVRIGEICVANEQLLVFVARIITEPGAKRLHAREKNTMGIKRPLPSIQSLPGSVSEA